MAKIISLHGFRGGNGKTVLTLNLAYWLACEGERILVVDSDFSAPAIQNIIAPRYCRVPKGTPTFADYLRGNVEINELKRLVVTAKVKDTSFDALVLGNEVDAFDYTALNDIITPSGGRPVVRMTERWYRGVSRLANLNGYSKIIVDMMPGYSTAMIVIMMGVSDVIIHCIKDGALECLQASRHMVGLIEQGIENKLREQQIHTQMFVLVNESLKDDELFFVKKYNLDHLPRIQPIKFDSRVRTLDEPCIVSAEHPEFCFSQQLKEIAHASPFAE